MGSVSVFIFPISTLEDAFEMRAGAIHVTHPAFSSKFEDADGTKVHFINKAASKRG